LRQHIESIDYLRAIMSVFVVIWHLGGLGQSGLFTMEYANHSVAISDIVNFYMLLVAVPMFFFISFYLFALSPPDYTSLFSRLKRFFSLYTFWVVVFSLIRGGPDLKTAYALLTTSLMSFYSTVFTGFTTVYYFFAILLVLVVPAYLLRFTSSGVLVVGLVVTTISLAILPSITEAQTNPLFSVYWSPWNFSPYIFLGILFAKKQEFIKKHKQELCQICVIGMLISMFVELKFSVGITHLKMQGFAIAAYTRSYLVFTVALIAIMVLTSSIKSNLVIRFMSKYSLALFCLHPFYMGLARSIVGSQGVVDTLLSTLLTVMFCYATAVILSHYLNKKILF